MKKLNLAANVLCIASIFMFAGCSSGENIPRPPSSQPTEAATVSPAEEKASNKKLSKLNAESFVPLVKAMKIVSVQDDGTEEGDSFKASFNEAGVADPAGRFQLTASKLVPLVCYSDLELELSVKLDSSNGQYGSVLNLIPALNCEDKDSYHNNPIVLIIEEDAVEPKAQGPLELPANLKELYRTTVEAING